MPTNRETRAPMPPLEACEKGRDLMAAEIHRLTKENERLLSADGPALFWLMAIDLHLDREVGQPYKDEPLAQDWARVAKVSEEVGEAINELILWTQQNPRKVQRGDKGSREALLSELADVVITGALAIQHFTKDAEVTRDLLLSRLEATFERIASYDRAKVG